MIVLGRERVLGGGGSVTVPMEGGVMSMGLGGVCGWVWGGGGCVCRIFSGSGGGGVESMSVAGGMGVCGVFFFGEEEGVRDCCQCGGCYRNNSL